MAMAPARWTSKPPRSDARPTPLHDGSSRPDPNRPLPFPLASATSLGILTPARWSRFVISPVKNRPSNIRSKLSATALALIALIAFSASGCGRRGALEEAPDPNAVVKPDDPAHPQGRPKLKPVLPPHTPFVMDPLL
jgi:hypothetical protein